MLNGHANLSPSSASRWVICSASPAAQAGRPNTTSDASRPGTCGHQLSAEVLEHGVDPQSYLGRVMGFPADGHEDWADKFAPGTQFEHTVTVDQDLIDKCVAYVEFVRQQVETLGGEIIVERQVPIGHITGEEGARGTSDAIILAGELLVTTDLKLGRGRVTAYDVIEPADVDVLTGEPTPPVLRMNLQLALYLLGSLEEYGLMGDFKRVRGVIVQPYLNHVSEYECSVEELLELGRWLSERAEATRKNPEFVPGNRICWFCKAKNDCHARNALVLESCLDGFDDVSQLDGGKPVMKAILVPTLGQLYGAIEHIRSWCDDVEAKTIAEVKAGNAVVGTDGKALKLVEGRKGNKVWDNPVEVEAAMNSWRIGQDVIYVRRILTPAEVEKLAKAKKGEEPTISKIRWNRIKERITQPSGKPTLALGSDPRPALPASWDMPEVSTTTADNADLF